MIVPGLDALLLAILALPLPLRYRILPIDGTPYWLFGIVFLLVSSHIAISIFPSFWSKYIPVITLKSWLLWSILAIVIGGITMTSIADRHRVAPSWGVHDITLQQEAAMRYLTRGKNPYKETYFGTPVESFHYDEMGKSAVNPALYHFVMPPWYLLFPFLFYSAANHTVGFFDGRMVLLFCLFATLFIFSRWFKHKAIAPVAIILTALSPLSIDYFIEGRSDSFAFFWLVASLFLLERRRFFWSAIIFGLALMSKQTIWFAVPFYGVYLWIAVGTSLKKIMPYLLICCFVVLSLLLPFLVWDVRALVDSVIFYLSAGGPTGYPISGYGLSMVLYEFGLIRDIHAYYPFIFWQLIIGLPVLVFSLWFMVKKPDMSRLFFGYACFLAAIWYTSRYFNNIHVGVIVSLVVVGVLKFWDETGGKIHEA